MLGRGVKRKWSCLEQLEADVLPEGKQQNGEDEEDADEDEAVLSRLQQRQRVLGLCLEKLQQQQAGMELSLRRSVLLVNTLRQIQEDARSDGAHVLHADSRLLRDGFREDVSVTCSGCADGEGDRLCLSPPVSPEFPSPGTNVSSEQQKAAPCSEAVNAVGYLSDVALDDIFEDIDTSMYETSDVPCAWASGSLWPFSVSLWADEDVKSLGSAGSLQSCLMDLNELDHIMEVLVES